MRELTRIYTSLGILPSFFHHSTLLKLRPQQHNRLKRRDALPAPVARAPPRTSRRPPAAVPTAARSPSRPTPRAPWPPPPVRSRRARRPGRPAAACRCHSRPIDAISSSPAARLVRIVEDLRRRRGVGNQPLLGELAAIRDGRRGRYHHEAVCRRAPTLLLFHRGTAAAVSKPHTTAVDIAQCNANGSVSISVTDFAPVFAAVNPARRWKPALSTTRRPLTKRRLLASKCARLAAATPRTPMTLSASLRRFSAHATACPRRAA